jgi:hypothetical protein
MGTSAVGGGNAVGGGAPAGAVGGGAPAGAVGGGAPANRTNNYAPAASGSAPSQQQAAPSSPTGNPPTSGGVIGGQTGALPSGQVAPTPQSPTGLAVPAEDGVSTKTVPSRPCSTAAKETDGTTTCVGIRDKR